MDLKEYNCKTKTLGSNMDEMIAKINKTSISGFTENLIISTSSEDKGIFLWDENTGTKVFSYDDSEIKTYIARNQLISLGRYSEYLVSLQENKNLITFFKTNTSEPFIKCNPFSDENKDGKVTSLDVSSDNKLIVFGTSIGQVYLYELFSGNLIINFRPHTGRINTIKFTLNDSAILTVSSDFYIKTTLIENAILTKDNSYTDLTHFSELVYGNKELKQIKLIGFPTTFILGINTDNTFLLISYPELKIVKHIYFSHRVLTFEISSDFEDVYIASDSKIYSLSMKDIWNNSSTTNFTDKTEELFSVEKPISSFCLGNRNFMVGTEDGVITCFNLSTFKQTTKFSQHKGKIINIHSISRPISQYGLNFNTNLEEVIVKSLKKTNNKDTNLISLNFSVNNKNAFNDLITNYTSSFDFFENIRLHHNVQLPSKFSHYDEALGDCNEKKTETVTQRKVQKTKKR